MKNKKLAVAIILSAIISAYLIFAGMKESISFYITPSEFFKDKQKYENRKLRIGGFVSELWSKELDYFFILQDGEFSIPVTFRGVPPDLFAKAKGAIVEGFWDKSKNIFIAEKIMAKHSEDYHPPETEIKK
jgi:cytochrome c-type biogenesis protein CcmE